MHFSSYLSLDKLSLLQKRPISLLERKGKSLSKLLVKMRTPRKDKNEGGHTDSNRNNCSGAKEN